MTHEAIPGKVRPQDWKADASDVEAVQLDDVVVGDLEDTIDELDPRADLDAVARVAPADLVPDELKPADELAAGGQ